jgi:hypothetical protein
MYCPSGFRKRPWPFNKVAWLLLILVSQGVGVRPKILSLATINLSESHLYSYSCPTSNTYEKANITILIVSDRFYQKHYLKNSETIQAYGARFNYDVKIVSPHDYKACQEISNFFFKKHCAVLQEMKAHFTLGRWIAVLDGDTAVRDSVNTNIRLESFLPPPEENKDVVHYYRFHNNEVMAGNYLVRHSDWSKTYLERWVNLHRTYPGTNHDNGALHWLWLDMFVVPPTKLSLACQNDYRKAPITHNQKKDLLFYDKFVGCVHRALSDANHSMLKNIYLYGHGMGWAYDGWVVEYRYSIEGGPLMHHAMKVPPIPGYTYDDREVSSLEVKNALAESAKRERKKRPLTGWKYTNLTLQVQKKWSRHSRINIKINYELWNSDKLKQERLLKKKQQLVKNTKTQLQNLMKS